MVDLDEYVPEEVTPLLDRSPNQLRSAIPDLARDPQRMSAVDQALDRVPTEHRVSQGDARNLSEHVNGADMVLTSPPYFDLKEYEAGDGQLGTITDYEEFLDLLGEVWQKSHDLLAPGGRLCVVVGDILRSRRQHGRHRLLPLHADIQRSAREAGFDCLAPIMWFKVGNADIESGSNTRFLGKPYEPGAAVKNDIEYVLLFRKPGGYRSPSKAQRLLSVIEADEHQACFTQLWTDISGTGSDDHPAPYPVGLAERLIRMYSFVGDQVVDPFAGSGTTSVAAARLARSSTAVELEPEYVELARKRVLDEVQQRGLAEYAEVSPDA